MGFFNTVVDATKQAFTPKLDWKGGRKALKSSFDGSRPNVSLTKETIDKEEFSKRYKHLQYTSIVTLLCIVGSLFYLPFASNLSHFIYCFSAVLLFSMFYYRYAFMMWVARQGWKSWSTINTSITKTGKDYLRCVYNDPGELMPKSLGNK